MSRDGELTRAQVDALRVLDNRPPGREWVPTWRRQSVADPDRPHVARVNHRAAQGLLDAALARLTLHGGRYEAQITAAGCAALAQAEAEQ